MKTSILRALASALLVLASGPTWAWGADGHHTVGAIADRLIAGSHAADQVQTLLDGVSLQDATVWADCVKGFDPAKVFAYTSAGKYPECKVFETPELEAEMADYVRRNDTNCPRGPGDGTCHAQYHYTDVAIQRSRYVEGLAGTQPFDVVGAITAAILVLKDEPAPAPFSIKSKREALLLLAHLVGDVHQPLHVGAIYLAGSGAVVDPDGGTFDPATSTRGGNEILTFRKATNRRLANLHQSWDDVPESLTPRHVDTAWVRQARAVPKTPGHVEDWPVAWATATLAQARTVAFAGLTIGAQQAGQWPTTLPYVYDGKMESVKKKQLTAAGSRLAQVLQAVWP